MLGKTPNDMEMVKYWKTKDKVSAKLTMKFGTPVMFLEGEKYPFPGFPRSPILYGKLSKLKHEIKNQIFNENWARLEKGQDIDINIALNNIYKLFEDSKYETLPSKYYCKSVSEIHRALKKVSNSKIIDILCHILQEDDAYRFRVQWIVTYFGWLRYFDPVKSFIGSLYFLEQAEVIDDMKERIRLLRRILNEILKNEDIKQKFVSFFKECDWDKVKLSKADKYYFRGKYFKVDYDKFEY